VDGCCDGTACDAETHASHHTGAEKLAAGLRFAFNELMDDLAGWFLLGVIFAGIITAVVPNSFFDQVLGHGLVSYLVMLVVSLPMYVCASASTPIAAAMVLKGLSPGAALVFLLAGPATNAATVAMVGGMLGIRALSIYLGSIAVCALGMAFATDWLFQTFRMSPVTSVIAGQQEFLPEWVHWLSAGILAILISRALWRRYGRNWLSRRGCRSGR
jgi:uncharacterized protein